MRVLFISRSHPPEVGGIARQNVELKDALGGVVELTTCINHKGRGFLPLFYVYATARSLRTVGRHDLVLLGDGVLSLLGAVTALLRRKPVCVVIHGLDVTYRSWLYQLVWVRYALNRCSLVIAVSHETRLQAIRRGVEAERVKVVPNGINTSGPEIGVQRKPVRSPEGPMTLVTVGRLVRRKGVAWFIREVLPLLPANTRYVVVGEGPARSEVEAAASSLAEPSRVELKGQVSDEHKRLLLSEADVFVQPNIRVDDDVEGFGLAVLEAALTGLPVVAADIEGIRDAVVDGENGLLVQAESPVAFSSAILGLRRAPAEADLLGSRARRYVSDHFSWEETVRDYVTEFQRVLDERSRS